jgi:putrescine transport system substrate-binding protein
MAVGGYPEGEATSDHNVGIVEVLGHNSALMRFHNGPAQIKANAHAFLNFLMKPEVIAKCTNFIGYANANKAANGVVDPAVLADPAIYPDAETQSRLWAPKALNEEQERALTRIFQDIKSG